MRSHKKPFDACQLTGVGEYFVIIITNYQIYQIIGKTFQIYKCIICIIFFLQQNGTWKKGFSKSEMNGNVTSLEMMNGSLDSSLANSPLSTNPEVRNKVLRPKSLVEKARMNVA